MGEKHEQMFRGQGEWAVEGTGEWAVEDRGVGCGVLLLTEINFMSFAKGRLLIKQVGIWI